MSFFRALAFTSCVLLSSCGTPPEVRAELAEIDRTAPICINDADCQAKWDAAKLWIAHNAGYKLQTATNVLLQTYGSVHGSPNIAVRATKKPLGGGQYKIVVVISCDNTVGCVPSLWRASLDFNSAVSAASPKVR